MKVLDLTQTIMENMPLFPGTPPPNLEVKHTVESDGFREMKITFYSHTGTHLDTPAHVFPGGKNLEEYSVDQFCGQGLILDFSRIDTIEISLKIFEQALKKALSSLASKRKVAVEDIAYLFIYTGWEEKWGENSYFSGAPYLSEAVARRLTTLNLKGVGIDAFSVDPLEGNMLLAHRVLLEADIIIVENLKNLGVLVKEDFEFYGLPLKLRGGEGSPIRAIAKIP